MERSNWSATSALFFFFSSLPAVRAAGVQLGHLEFGFEHFQDGLPGFALFREIFEEEIDFLPADAPGFAHDAEEFPGKVQGSVPGPVPAFLIIGVQGFAQGGVPQHGLIPLRGFQMFPGLCGLVLSGTV